jgi:hypothetical protein
MVPNSGNHVVFNRGNWVGPNEGNPSIKSEMPCSTLFEQRKKPELDEHQRKLVQEKRAEFEARTKQTDAFSKSHFPEGAQLCAKRITAAVVMMNGCNTCLNCGDSKCM